MKYLRSTLLDGHTMATETKSVDLPINPLSHLILTIEGTDATDEATVAEILAFLNTVEVTHRGESIINMESEDLAALNLYLFGSAGVKIHAPFGTSPYLAYSLMIPFGRTLYNPMECYPATRKGEFKIKFDTTIPSSSFTAGKISVETVELIDAEPIAHLKSTLLSVSAPGATGIFDTEIPIGNDLLAILIGMTAFPLTTTFTFTVDDMKLLCDNVENQMASAKTPALLADLMLRTNARVHEIAAQGLFTPKHYAWMDFDPTRDGEYVIHTNEFSSVKCRLTYGKNEAINLVPVELVSTE